MVLQKHSQPFPVSRSTTLGALSVALLAPGAGQAQAFNAARLQSWPLNTPGSTGIHDLAPAPDGGVWFSAQRSGHLGWFNPRTGQSELVALGSGSSPHGVIAGPDGAAWLTDGGQNAIVRVSWPAREVKLFPCLSARPTPTSTPALLMAMATCGLPGKAASWAKWRGAAAWSASRRRRAGAGPTAFAPHRGARSGGARWPAPSLRRSTARPASHALSSRPLRARARAASGPTVAGVSGWLNGTAASSRCTTRRWARQPVAGANGRRRAPSRACMPCTWTTKTWSGPRSGATTPCCALTRAAKSSMSSRCRVPAPTSDRTWADLGRCGCQRAEQSLFR